jgi:hypothetical protein
MRVICEGTYIEHGRPAAFQQDELIELDTDCADFDSVYLHLTGPGGHHTATIDLSAEDARALSRKLKNAAAEAQQ